MTKKEAISAFVRAGYALTPLKGKIPTRSDWQKTQPGDFHEDDFKDNYGVVLKDDDLVIDADPRNYNDGDKPLIRLGEAIGVQLQTLVVQTGGGGFHIYLKIPSGLKVRNTLPEYPGIEFKSANRQVVGPGSIHPESGETYVIVAGSVDKIKAAPASLIKLVEKPAIGELPGTGEYKNDEQTKGRYVEFLKAVANPSVQGQRGDDNAFRVAASGRDLGLSPATVWELMLIHWNPRCSPIWNDEDLKEKVLNAYQYSTGALGAQHPSAAFGTIDGASQQDADEEVSWKLGKNDKAVQCFQNLLNYFLMPTTGLKGIFGYNEFTRRVEFVAPAPWHAGKMPVATAITDIDLQRLRAHLARKHSWDTTVNDLIDAIVEMGQRRKFHPVRAYLSRLKWDQKPRLDSWLTKYCGAEDSAYTRAVARKTLCAAVKRVFDPGCKFDHVLVLEGGQGLGKSSIIRILGGEWFGDFKVDVDAKDTIQLMQGKWIVEMADLNKIRQADIDDVKAFLTRQTDEARFAYGRLPGQYSRQSIFIASYNPSVDGTYLKDDTGNRRWWPVACRPVVGRKFDFANLAADRDQIFAEAVYKAMQQGEPLSMETEELEDAALAAADYRHGDDPWTERISAWIYERDKNPETKVDFYTGRQIWIEAMQGLDKQFGRRESLQIARVFRDLRWKPGFSRIDGVFYRGYVREKFPSKKKPELPQPIDIFEGFGV